MEMLRTTVYVYVGDKYIDIYNNIYTYVIQLFIGLLY